MRALLAALLLAATPLAANPPSLEWPIDCTLGDTCFIEDFVDNDPIKGRIRDHACGLNTRDGHKGTDIALLSFDTIDDGITVRASAAGRIKATRDSMPDDRQMRGVTAQNACGNAVVIEHQSGWTTTYCHLRKGSVTVRTGDIVKPGDTLGLVGLSGRTNHPHLHLTLRHNNQVVDPFRPDTAQSCDKNGKTLWATPLTTHDTLVRNAGFSDRVPDYKALRSGNARKSTLPATSALIVYAEAGFARHGDVVTISATGPSGDEIFRHTRIMKSPRKSQLPAFGRKAPANGWPTGDYLGEVLLTRKGEVIGHRFAHVSVVAN